MNLESLTEQALAEARRELEQTGGVTPLFVICLADGTIQKAGLPGKMAEIMNYDKAKERLFEFLRGLVRSNGITAVASLIDAYLSKTTPKGVALLNRDRAEFERQAKNTDEAVRNGLFERREALVVTTQDAERVVIVNQFYLRHNNRTVSFDERTRMEFHQADFKGRMKMYGDLRQENLE